MTAKRIQKRFDAIFKAKIAIDALKEQSTLAQLSSKHGVQAKRISAWKNQALKGMPSIFSSKKSTGQEDHDALVSSLYEEIGRLKVELDWYKKKSEYFT